MEVTIYLDVLWLRSLLVELSICCFVNLWMRQNRPFLRILWMCALCVSVEVLLFALAGYGVFTLGSLGLRLLLIFFLFQPQNPGIFFRILCWTFVGTVTAGGMMLLVRERLSDQLWFPMGMLAGGIFLIAAAVLEERRQIHDRELYKIELSHKDKQISVIGLCDTGNRLMDPYVHDQVHILARREAENLQLDPGKCRFIPCASVGDAHGLLQVWTIDGMQWENHGKRQRRSPVQIGVGEDVLFQGKDYRLILAAGFDRL